MCYNSTHSIKIKIHCTCVTSACFVFQQHGLNSTRFQSFQDESYVPMASPSPSAAPTESDGYIPMSPSTFSLLNSNCSAESSTTIGPLMCPPGDFVPPPIHRHLKPRLRRGERRNSWQCVENVSILSWDNWFGICYSFNEVYKCRM